MKSKKWFLVGILLIGLVSFFQFFVYKPHRNVTEEKASKMIEANQLINEFTTNLFLSQKKYTDKVLIINGTVTYYDARSGLLTLNEKIGVQTLAPFPTFQLNERVRIKGRLVGFDDLLMEIKIDEATIFDN